MRGRNAVRFRLYVAGGAQNSALAIANLQALCKTHLPGRHNIEITDVFREPERALSDGIYLTPTLVRLGTPTRKSVVGTLSDEAQVLRTLGLEALDR